MPLYPMAKGLRLYSLRRGGPGGISFLSSDSGVGREDAEQCVLDQGCDSELQCLTHSPPASPSLPSLPLNASHPFPTSFPGFLLSRVPSVPHSFFPTPLSICTPSSQAPPHPHPSSPGPLAASSHLSKPSIIFPSFLTVSLYLSRC